MNKETFFKSVDNSVFYIPSYKIERTFFDVKNFKLDDLNKLYADPQCTEMRIFMKDIFVRDVKINEKETGTILPPGQYRHIYDPYANDPKEFLVKFDVRANETYLEIPELNPFLTDMKNFLHSRQTYIDLGFPYRRGYIAYGPPGNGKTTMIRQLLRMPEFKDVHCIWLQRIPSHNMIQTLNKIDSVKIVIFEEISPEDQNVSFSQSELLTFMDGESSLTNCITIATTNYPFLLAKNLADRPSRFDFKFEFKNPSSERIYHLLSTLLNREVTESDVLVQSMSFAQVKEVVLQHKMFNITLQEAHDKVIDQSKLFEKGFEEKKSFGL